MTDLSDLIAERAKRRDATIIASDSVVGERADTIAAFEAVVLAVQDWRERILRGQEGGYPETCAALDNLTALLGGGKR